MICNVYYPSILFRLTIADHLISFLTAEKVKYFKSRKNFTDVLILELSKPPLIFCVCVWMMDDIFLINYTLFDLQ